MPLRSAFEPPARNARRAPHRFFDAVRCRHPAALQPRGRVLPQVGADGQNTLRGDGADRRLLARPVPRGDADALDLVELLDADLREVAGACGPGPEAGSTLERSSPRGSQSSSDWAFPSASVSAGRPLRERERRSSPSPPRSPEGTRIPYGSRRARPTRGHRCSEARLRRRPPVGRLRDRGPA